MEFLGVPPLMNSSTRKRGIGMIFAMLVMLSPSGTGRTMVWVVFVFIIFARSGQNHACVPTKSFVVSFRTGGKSNSLAALLQKASMCPLFGCCMPKAMPRHLMPCSTITLLSGLMTGRSGKGAGCLPKMRICVSGVHTNSGVNMPLNICWESWAPSMGLSLAPSMRQAHVRGPLVLALGKLML